jgi:hypothetical protein
VDGVYLEQEHLKQKKPKYFSKRFIILLVCTFIVMTVIVYASAVSSYEYALVSERGQIQANNTRQEIQARGQTITALELFLNNFLLGIPLVLPVFGFLWFGRILINTGLTLGVLAYSFNVTPATYLLAAYLPIGFIETLAYSILSTESFMFLHATFKKKLRLRLRCATWKVLLLYVALLMFGAIMEYMIIHS